MFTFKIEDGQAYKGLQIRCLAAKEAFHLARGQARDAFRAAAWGTISHGANSADAEAKARIRLVERQDEYGLAQRRCDAAEAEWHRLDGELRDFYSRCLSKWHAEEEAK